MNEIYDKFVIRIAFTLLFIIVLISYKYLHFFLYPSTSKQIKKRFTVDLNSADTIHFFSRLLGFAIIFSQLHFILHLNLKLTLVNFLIKSIFAVIYYLLSCFILENNILYNYLYEEEILKKKNLAYAIASMTHSLCAAYLLKNIFLLSNTSIPFLTIIWMVTIIMLGIACRLYQYYTKKSLNTAILQQDLAGAISYLGFIGGCSIILASSLNHQVENIQWYLIQFILKLILSLIFLPIIISAINHIFNLRYNKNNSLKTNEEQNLSSSIYESILFFSASLFVIVITNQIGFNNIYF